jgi:chemotaxis protein methyltransferase CheR
MTAQDFEFVCRLVRDRSAIVLEPGKEYLVEGRLTPIARQLELGSVSALVARLRTGPDNGLAVRVVEAMATTETSFFRDLHPFETLRTAVLPDLIRRRAGEKRLEVWCAACSTGQEPYSLAILLRQHFPDLAGWRVSSRSPRPTGLRPLTRWRTRGRPTTPAGSRCPRSRPPTRLHRRRGG